MGSFAKKTEAKYEEGVIRFYLETDGQRRQYEISGDALLQAFQARDETGNALLEAFEQGSEKIQQAAEAAASTPTDGIIVLGSGDFESEGDRGLKPCPRLPRHQT